MAPISPTATATMSTGTASDVRQPSPPSASGGGMSGSGRSLLIASEHSRERWCTAHTRPQHRQGQHRGDHDRPAPVGPGAPHHERHGQRQSDPERHRDVAAERLPRRRRRSSGRSSRTRPAGASTKDTAAITAVAPSAIPSWRHSRRTANQSRPTPALGLVSSTNDHVHGMPEAEHDGHRQQDVDVAVVQLQRHHRDGEGHEDPRGAAGEPDDRADQQAGPDPEEDPEVERAEPSRATWAKAGL